MKTILALAMAAALSVGTAAAAEPVVLKFATGANGISDIYAKTMSPWLDRVEAASKGTLKIEKYPDGSLSKEGQTVDRVVGGVADIGHDIPVFYGQRFGGLNIVTLPFLFDNSTTAAAALWRVYEKQLLPELADVKMLAFVVNPNTGIFLKQPIKSPSDLAGTKIGVGSKVRGEMIQKMGGVGVSLIVPELYQAVSRGVVDGIINNVAILQAVRVEELLHYYIDGPFGGGITMIFMNKAKYDSLPPEAKKAIDDNSGMVLSRRASDEVQASEAAIMERLLKDPANKKVVLSGADLDKWKTTLSKVADDWVQTRPNGQALLDGFRAAYESESKVGK